MSQQFIRKFLSLIALGLLTAKITLAQTPSHSEESDASLNTWQVAQQTGPSRGRLFVVTVDRPERRQTCRIKSFTSDALVCSRPFGAYQTYLPQQIIALILHGDGGFKIRALFGINAGMGAAIWGTVVLTAICPPCAVGTGITAFLLFGAAGAVLIGDDQPNQLLYLAPGRQLSRTLGYVQSRPPA